MATKKREAKKTKAKVKQPSNTEVRDSIHSVVLNTTAALGEKLDKTRTSVARVEESTSEIVKVLGRLADVLERVHNNFGYVIGALDGLRDRLTPPPAPASEPAVSAISPEGVIDVRTDKGMTLNAEPAPWSAPADTAAKPAAEPADSAPKPVEPLRF
jgi:hypothetical protein